MTEDMPTVDGARAEAERLDYISVVIDGDRQEFRRGSFGYAMAEAHLKALARADAAEAAIERVRAVCSQIELMPILADPGMSQTGITGRIVSTIVRAVRRAALSDAAPQAVGVPKDTRGDRFEDYYLRGGMTAEQWAAPEVVETAEALDALPVGSVVRTAGESVFEQTFEDCWERVGYSMEWSTAELVADFLPARVLYRPDATDGREGA